MAGEFHTFTFHRRWWWLSFADGRLPEGEQFLGACLVRAVDFVDAVKEAWAHVCNPGGECRGEDAHPELEVPEAWAYRVLARAEAEQILVELEAQVARLLTD